MSFLRFAQPRFLFLFIMVLLAAFAAGGGALEVRNAEAFVHGDRNIACWVTGVLEPGVESSLLGDEGQQGWGKPNEFVIDYADYASGQPPPARRWEVEEVQMSTGASGSLLAPAVVPSTGDKLYQCARDSSKSDHTVYDDPCQNGEGGGGSGPSCRAYVYQGTNPDAGAHPPGWGSCILELDGPHTALTPGDRVPLRFMVPVETPAFFFSYPELVDYTFAMGYEAPDPDAVEAAAAPNSNVADPVPSDSAINDVRTRRVVGLFNRFYRSDEALVEGLGYVPWGDGSDSPEARKYYLQRRSVSRSVGPSPVNNFEAGWYTDGNPSGGIAVDRALLMADQRSVDAEHTVEQESSMGRGHRLIQGSQQNSGLDISIKRTQVCQSAGNGVVCTSTSEASSEAVLVWGPFNATDTNSGETGRNEITDGVLRVGVYDDAGDRIGTDDRRVDGHKTNPSLLTIYKNYVPSSYADIKRPPSGGDEIRISLDLHSKFRNDYDFEIFESKGGSRMPAFGRHDSRWTYAHYAPASDIGGRDTALNQRIPETKISGGTSDVHVGYRQPRLEWGYLHDDVIETKTVDHIRWPVNLQDLNWYLYRLPESVPGDPQWLLWTNYHGRSRLVQSGFGLSAAEFFPGPLPGESAVGQPDLAPGNDKPACSIVFPTDVPDVDDKPLLADLIVCGLFPDEPDWGYGGSSQPDPNVTARDALPFKLLTGNQRDVYLPFGTIFPTPAPAPGDPEPKVLLDESYLVKQGSEQPMGSPNNDSLIGTRPLDKFRWSVDESYIVGNGSLSRLVGDEGRRFGIPGDPEARNKFLKKWPADPIDPHSHYLMVVTFYEHKLMGVRGGSKFSDPRSTGPLNFDNYRAKSADYRPGSAVASEYDASFSLPKRALRRVVCRFLIQPSGIDSDVPDTKGLVEEVKDFFAGQFGDLLGGLAQWLHGLLRSIHTTPGGLMGMVTDVACTGVDKLDQVRGGDRPVQASRVDSDGTIVNNSAARSKIEGKRMCGSVASPEDDICDSSVAFILASEGRCTSLPQLRLRIARTEYIEPKEKIYYRRFFHDFVGEVNERGNWGGAGGLRSGDIRVIHPSDRALEDVPAGDFDQVDLNGISYSDAYAFSPIPGTPYGLRPPPEDSSDVALTSHNIGLTRVYISWSYDSGIQDLIDRKIHGYLVRVVPDHKVSSGDPLEVQEFVVPKVVRELGRLALDDNGVLKPLGSRDLLVEGITFGGLHWYPEGDSSWGSDSLIRFWEGLYHPADDSTSDPTPENRPKLTTNLGSVSNMEYRGFNALMGNLPIALGFRHTISIAPYHVEPGVGISVGPFSDPLLIDGDTAACLVAGSAYVSDDTKARVLDLYDCGAEIGAPISAPPEEFRPGILSLTGTEICTDIFTTTEGIYTWDNPIVKQGWRLMWIIAGAVFFSLLVWQGLRMTYDIWLDPQPIIGFRELVPRFLLAILLAAASLVICRIVLVIASDLTCFVAQMTGMSMWGSVGYTFGGILEGYIAWITSLVSDLTLTELIKAAIITALTGMFVVFIVIFILYLFVKVFLAMLMRLPLLAVLIVFSPLAFAFYASDSTSHWTKKWISIFLGTTFQQVVVLMVLFIGSNLLYHALSGAMDSTFGNLVTGLLMSLLVLALADKVPSIVNPAGQGLFASFGDMAKMGMTGAMVGAGVAVGAAGGGISALRGGSTVGVNASGGGNLPGGPGGGGPAGGPSSPGGPAGGPSSPGGPGGGGGGGTAGGGTGPMSGLRGSTFAGAQQDSGGFMSQVRQGAQRGAQWGQRANTRVADVSSGNAFYEHSSRSDDAARSMQQMRGDYRSLSNSMRQLDNTISQRYPPAQTP